MPLLTLLRDRKWTSYQGLDRKWERDWIIRLNSFSISQQSQLDTALICSRKSPRPAMHFFHSRPYIFSKPNRHTENLFSGIRNQPINDLKTSRLFKIFLPYLISKFGSDSVLSPSISSNHKQYAQLDFNISPRHYRYPKKQNSGITPKLILPLLHSTPCREERMSAKWVTSSYEKEN